MTAPAWEPALRELLVAAAEVHIDHPDQPARQWPLAPHYRFELLEDGQWCVWLRPLPAPLRHPDGTATFELSRCRRYALVWTDVAVDGDTVTARTRADQTVTIRPASPAHRATVDAWTTFVGVRLTAEEELELDGLLDDGWDGRYA